MQYKLAILLLKIDFKNIVFINKANIYSKYRKKYLQYISEKYYYPDIKSNITKQAYQKAEFIEAIK